VITFIEVLVGITDTSCSHEIQEWLSSFTIIDVTQDIGLHAVTIRQKTKLKIPDAVILATAQLHGMVLVTRNTKDFNEKMPYVHVPYERSIV
jgi:hypothetical protein